jgi:hypothetical protein
MPGESATRLRSRSSTAGSPSTSACASSRCRDMTAAPRLGGLTRSREPLRGRPDAPPPRQTPPFETARRGVRALAARGYGHRRQGDLRGRHGVRQTGGPGRQAPSPFVSRRARREKDLLLSRSRNASSGGVRLPRRPGRVRQRRARSHAARLDSGAGRPVGRSGPTGRLYRAAAGSDRRRAGSSAAATRGRSPSLNRSGRARVALHRGACARARRYAFALRRECARSHARLRPDAGKGRKP